MATETRWREAQNYERGFWEGVAQRIVDGAESQMEWYKWRADQLSARLDSLGWDRARRLESVVLEVGSGPIGVVSFFEAAERVTVDPLEHYYGSNPVLTALRDSAVDYRQGAGEALPVEDATVDLLIIENCIDHVREIDAVMRELVRVIKPGGLLYLTVNCRSPVGYYVHRALSRLAIDAGHPHTFTPPRIEQLVRSHGFDIESCEVESYWRSLKADITSRQMKARAKAVLGVSEFIASIIARKPESGGR